MAKQATTVRDSAKSFNVYSTLTASQEYTAWDTTGDLPRVKFSVMIKGGSNIVNRRTLLTPYGVATAITAEEKDFLEQCPSFLAHQAGGWVRIIKTGISGAVEADKVARDMAQRDGGSPLVPNDLEKLGGRFKSPLVAHSGDADYTPPTTAPRSMPFLHQPMPPAN